MKDIGKFQAAVFGYPVNYANVVGPLGLNPGSLAPQASILIHARRRPHEDTCFSKGAK